MSCAWTPMSPKSSCPPSISPSAFIAAPPVLLALLLPPPNGLLTLTGACTPSVVHRPPWRSRLAVSACAASPISVARFCSDGSPRRWRISASSCRKSTMFWSRCRRPFSSRISFWRWRLRRRPEMWKWWKRMSAGKKVIIRNQLTATRHVMSTAKLLTAGTLDVVAMPKHAAATRLAMVTPTPALRKAKAMRWDTESRLRRPVVAMKPLCLKVSNQIIIELVATTSTTKRFSAESSDRSRPETAM
mmetsp:Transcript_34542/g.106700  ORF Transcript_34542/g.106700 Transcript_34542/m.106700 type:complete len:245 (-) Transcript_34542:1311-2045(-)